jgi:mono/diheme cytochrome c family protein
VIACAGRQTSVNPSRQRRSRVAARRACSLGVALLLVLLAARAWAADGGPAGKRPVDYNRDIRPLFANHCYACHGPDGGKRRAGLRLDVREVAVRQAIVPGDAANSPLVERISSSDPDERMPPPASKRPPLSAAAIALIRQWIAAGAKFDPHWAYVPPARPPLPEVKQQDWPRNPIDRFIAAAQEERGLRPSPEADPRRLVRRLWLDLTGLAPGPEEIDAFRADHSPAAFERQVERLLASPHYGERMATYWLDVARYADSCGYHSDNEREVWMYRDYVIQAFRDNKPFDRFTVEQLAGDLLPDAGREQKIASGYNRLLQTTEEGGAQPKEYTAKYAADRVRNTATAWLGSTLGCAQCHDHKFDPFKTKDFYCFAAFFADVQESAVGRQPQTPMPTPEQAAELSELDRQIAELERGGVKGKPGGAKDEGRRGDAGTPRRGEGKEKAAAAKEKPGGEKLAALKRRKEELVKAIPTTLISVAGPPRVVRVLHRGNWQDDSGELVEPAVPAFFGRLEVKDRRANRLDLARWLVARQNPLVARVFVNRLWKLFFGQGLVKTLDDCGTQGALPTHPELLDWLAVEFIASGWDVKHMVRLIVTSRTYQQSSQSNAELDGRDPANLWLARQGRWRLDAEMIRDNALAVSGLLVRRVGGPSVKPYQPAGYWDFLNFPTRQWVADHGENQYRRGLYTFRQRTFLQPSLLAFDASTNEECTVERAQSNTPMQALVLLDDPTYVEAARVFAARILLEGGKGTAPLSPTIAARRFPRESGQSPAERLRLAFRQALGREPAPAESELLLALHEKQLAAYKADEAAARKLLAVGDAKAPDGLAPVELAAWTAVARVILNLHELITRN